MPEVAGLLAPGTGSGTDPASSRASLMSYTSGSSEGYKQYVGTLYVVATPIGNLEDITLRALRILKEVPLVAAEDTRVTRTLFRAHDIHTPLVSFHEFTSPARRGTLVERLADGEYMLNEETGKTMPGLSPSSHQPSPVGR